MSITDELRKYVKDHTNWDVALTTYPPQRTMTYHEGAMDAIADRIDAEHAEAQRRWMAELDAAREQSFNAGFDDGFASADDWLAQHEDAMREHGWVKLPKDADGEYIHIGDVLAPPADCDDYVPLQVTSLTYDGYEKEWFFDGEAGGFCGLAGQHMDVAGWTHYCKQPTVEDVLREFAGTLASVENNWGSYVNDAIAEYAKRLKLAGDGE